MKIGRAGFRKKVEAEGENALGVLVNLVDWLDGLEPQPTTATDQAVAKEATYPVVSSSTLLHPLGTRILSSLGTGCEPEAPFQSQGQWHTGTKDRAVRHAQSRQNERSLAATMGGT